MIPIVRRKGACFFELDGVVRCLKNKVKDVFIDRYHEVPPVPMKPGQQTLIMPVVEWMKDYCSRERIVAIGLDQAPYLAHGFDEEDYAAILKELIGMLREAGLPVANIYTCDHAGREICDFEELNGVPVEVKRIVPDCKCKFPNPGLLFRAAGRHDVTLVDNYGGLRFLPPSILVHVTKEGRDAAIDNAGLNTQHAEAIRTGVVRIPDLVQNVHLTAAALIKDHQKKSGLLRPSPQFDRDPRAPLEEVLEAQHRHDMGVAVHIDVRDLPTLPALPPELNRPFSP